MENKTFRIKGFVIILHVAMLHELRVRFGGVLLVVFSKPIADLPFFSPAESPVVMTSETKTIPTGVFRTRTRAIL